MSPRFCARRDEGVSSVNSPRPAGNYRFVHARREKRGDIEHEQKPDSGKDRGRSQIGINVRHKNVKRSVPDRRCRGTNAKQNELVERFGRSDEDAEVEVLVVRDQEPVIPGGIEPEREQKQCVGYAFAKPVFQHKQKQHGENRHGECGDEQKQTVQPLRKTFYAVGDEKLASEDAVEQERSCKQSQSKQ